ncbi:MAG TPA: GNAT family N-acetyltransferase [Acidimicrobiia bacterium]|jgi:GNAT superfamily N-acetyltransferase
MVSRCSIDSRYARFLAPLPAIPPEHLHRILTPSPCDAAWVGFHHDDPTTVVALGSWSRAGDDEAELALLVEDAWQRCGIGSGLLALVVDAAWKAGICRLTATVLRESLHVLRMLRAIIGPIVTRGDGFVSRVTVDRCV